MRLSTILPRFLAVGFRKYISKYPSCFFLHLPVNVYVDFIFPFLTLEDIMCLRRVNKALFLLTHEPSIWKRFLMQINHRPALYLRPTLDYSDPDTDYEIEQIVSRTISVDDNWRNEHSKVFNRFIVETHYDVLDITLVPGGKYLLSSVRDKDSYRFFIILYILDHPNGPRAIARLPTISKAYWLQAKYMQLPEGGYGIVFSFIRRRWLNGGPDNIDPSDYSHKYPIDNPRPLRSEVVAYSIRLDILEDLVNPNVIFESREYFQRVKEQYQSPFDLLCQTETSSNIQLYALFENDGQPWIAAVTNDIDINFIHCSGIYTVPMTCQRIPGFSEDAIMAILPLPEQKEILVIRKYSDGWNEEWTAEMYSFPREPTNAPPRQSLLIHRPENREKLLRVIINDPQISRLHPSFPQLKTPPPPPISIYFEYDNPSGIIHYGIWPTYEQLAGRAVRYFTRYSIEPDPGKASGEYYNHCGQSIHSCHPHVPHVLPGALRAVYYTTFPSDRSDAPAMIRLRRYLCPDTQWPSYPKLPRNTAHMFMRKGRKKFPIALFATIDIPLQDLELCRKDGVAAATFDEGTGRICLAVEGEQQIRIMDTASFVEPDKRFADWKEKIFQQIHDQTCCDIFSPSNVAICASS